MTGADHYRMAERILAVALQEAAGRQGQSMPAESAALLNQQYAGSVATAQVHATLALAAATALNVPSGDSGGMWVADAEAWEAAASAAHTSTPAGAA